MPKFDLANISGSTRRSAREWRTSFPPVRAWVGTAPVVDQFDLSSLEIVMSGAAPVGTHLQLALAQRLRCSIKQGYG